MCRGGESERRIRVQALRSRKEGKHFWPPGFEEGKSSSGFILEVELWAGHLLVNVM